MAKQYRHTVTVRGSNIFPIDMLRYDKCWPKHEADSHAIALDFYKDGAHQMRVVQLLTDDYMHFTPDRWKSFGWEVVKAEKVL